MFKSNSSIKALFCCFVVGVLFQIMQASAASWVNKKTEYTKVEDGIYIERTVNSSTGEVLSEETVMKTAKGFFQVEKKSDGSWGLTEKGQADQAAAESGGGNSGGGGGGGGC
jgi:hypothetical protein